MRAESHIGELETDCFIPIFAVSMRNDNREYSTILNQLKKQKEYGRNYSTPRDGWR